MGRVYGEGASQRLLYGGSAPERGPFIARCQIGIETRMVVAADGRDSACRKWAGFTVREQANDYYMAGVLLNGVHSSPDVRSELKRVWWSQPTVGILRAGNGPGLR